jgi:flagellar M-ring protein FliF
MATTTATFQPSLAAPQGTASGTANLPSTTGNASTLALQDGAMPMPPTGPFAPVQQWMQQPQVRKALPFMLMAVVLLLFAVIYTTVNAPTYRPLVGNMSEADQQTAMEALKQAEFKPVLDANTGQITVPSQRYHEARIFLASKGLPKSGPAGLDGLKDQSAMTTSQFMEQVRYISAMEQEIARTILQIESIQNARVHLAMPKQSTFVRDRTPPKASVVITPYPGRSVTPTQVQALVHLVASSVAQMTPDNVTVVDNQGKLFTDTAAEATMGLTGAQAQHKQKLEELYRQRVMQILSPIVGDANVRSQVNMTLDFTQTEVTSEDFDRSDKGPKTRSESLSQDNNTIKEASGVPGALSNTAPQTATTTTDTATNQANDGASKTGINSRSTRNFELDRMVRHIKEATGKVERLSVAVVLNERPPTPGTKNDKGEMSEAKPNPYTPEEVERLQSLVRGVVGFNQERGDVVTVVPARFEPEPVYDLSTPWYKDDAVMANVKTGVLALLFAAFLMMVVRPAVMHVLNQNAQQAADAAALLAAEKNPVLPDGELSEEEMKNIQLGEGESLEDIKAKLKPKKSNIPLEMLDTANTYDDKVALVRMIVADDAGRVASVFKNMIKV